MGGALLLLAYVILAKWRGHTPQFGDAAPIFLAVSTLLGAVRLVGFLNSAQFERMIKAAPQDPVWNFGYGDATFVVFGALALIWTTYAGVHKIFAKLFVAPEPASPGSGVAAENSASG